MADNETSTRETPASPKIARPKRAKGRKPQRENAKRVRTARVYPALSFEESLPLAEAIHTHASGERVARLTLLKQMNLSPTSSATQILITSSGKYGITKGSYAADHLELTPIGRVASDKSAPQKAKVPARFALAIKNIKPFEVLYSRYRGKKLPSHDVLKDVLREANLQIADEKECIDTFIVNAKFLGLLQTIAGSETLLPVETLLEQLPEASHRVSAAAPLAASTKVDGPVEASTARSHGQWQSICFVSTRVSPQRPAPEA